MQGVLKNGSTGSESVVYLSKDQEGKREFFVDPETNTDLEVIDKMTLLEWLAENYKTFGTSLEFVTNKSQEGSQFVKGFGGIGGLLRYKVEFSQFQYDSDEYLSD